MQFIFRSVRRSMAILLLTGLFASAGDMRTWTAQLVAPSMVNAVQPIFLASAPAADLPPPLEFKQPAIVIPRAVKVFGFTFMAQAPEKFTPRLAEPHEQPRVPHPPQRIGHVGHDAVRDRLQVTLQRHRRRTKAGRFEGGRQRAAPHRR